MSSLSLGGGEYGQLGDGAGTDSATPVEVSGLTDVTNLDAGSGHTCAVRGDGSAWCWGSGGSGAIGNGTHSNWPSPVQVTGLTDATVITAGEGHTCAADSSGTAWCWGANGSDQLGAGSTSFSHSVPQQVMTLTDTISIDASSGFTCAVQGDGSAWCWGHNRDGRLGNGTATVSATTPEPVTGITDAASIHTGYEQACALSTDGSIWCWGKNLRGQLGIGTVFDSYVPVQVLGISTAVLTSYGSHHGCCQKDDGSAWCWGSNSFGRIGDGTTTHAPAPVMVSYPP